MQGLFYKYYYLRLDEDILPGNVCRCISMRYTKTAESIMDSAVILTYIMSN